MRRTIVLASVAAVAVAGGLISFSLVGTGTAQKQAALPEKAMELELVTGAITARRETAPPQALAPGGRVFVAR